MKETLRSLPRKHKGGVAFIGHSAYPSVMIPAPTIVRSVKRRRTVALHVEADGTLKIHAPVRTSLGWIQDFITQKASWIARRRAVLAQRALCPLPQLEEGCKVPFLGQDHVLQINVGNRSEDKPQHRHHEALSSELAMTTPFITLNLPTPLSDPSVLQAELKTELALWYKKQARQLFQERLTVWASHMGVSPTRLVINAPKRQWGSCNSKNEIRLNWRLIMAEPALLDYVIVHELAHIPHKNHGKRFWDFVGKFIPDAKEKRQRLKIFNKTPFHLMFS